MTAHRAAESHERAVKVIEMFNHGKERTEVASIQEAVDRVQEILDDRHPQLLCAKIYTRDDDIVYDSSRHGNISAWAKEWRRAKRSMELEDEEETHTCPYEVFGCTSEEYCMQCKIDNQIKEAQEW